MGNEFGTHDNTKEEDRIRELTMDDQLYAPSNDAGDSRAYDRTRDRPWCLVHTKLRVVEYPTD